MRKVWVVAGREYRTQVRSKAFVISLVLMPVLILGSVALPRLLRGRVDVEDKRVVVADATGKVLPRLQVQALERDRQDVRDPATGRQIEARFILEPAPGPRLTDGQRLALSERVRKRELHAFAEIDAGALGPSAVEAGATVRLHLLSAASGGLGRWFNRAVHQAVTMERLQAQGLDPAAVARATRPVPVAPLGLFARGSDGTIRSGDEGSRQAALTVPIAVLVLTFFAIMMSQVMLQSTLEEKQQRIAEVLLGSARPGELMLGKLLGNTGVALTTIGIYMAGGAWVLNEQGHLGLLRGDLLAATLVFQALGVLVFGSVFGAIGAACSELKEAQNLLMPVMLVLFMPLTIWWKVLEEPTGAFATGLSLIPLWTPLLMPLRMATTEAVPLWQPILGGLLTVALAAAAIWAAGRVFRVGLLLQGKPPRPLQLLGWIIRG